MPRYDPPTGGYTTTIPNGVRDFRRAVADGFGYARTEVVRDKARCQQQASEHCESRAVDAFTTDLAKGRKLFDWCVAHADTLGIQSVIFNRRVWGFGTWTERAYTGSSPHTDHVHIGLNRTGAVENTYGGVMKLINSQEDQMTPEQERKLDQVLKFASDVHPHLNNVFGFTYDVHGRIKRTETGVATLQTGAIDYDRLATEVAERLSPQIAQAVADVLSQRLKD